jgi:hypothetical protein
MRLLLPEGRPFRVALAGGLALLAALFAFLLVASYRPWEARYLGRPTSWWEEALAREKGALGRASEWRRWFESPGPIEVGPHLRALRDAGPEAVPLLVELLSSPDLDTRSLACLFLGHMGPAARPAVPALRAVVADPGRADGEDALWALERITPGFRAEYEREKAQRTKKM